MKKYLLFLIFTIFSNGILAQTLDKTDYVVFNFVHRHHGSIRAHSGNFVDNYYWIVPVDSIKIYHQSTFTITPLVVNAETQIEVDNCAKGNVANFFGLWEGASEEYVNEIDLFTKLVNKHRKKIQTITLNWHNESSRKKEKIEVYAIPISGTFCKCIQVFYRGASKDDEFSELPFFIPFSDFIYNESFWESQEWKIVKYVDYSIVNFASLTPWGHQYKTGSLVKTSR